MGNEKANSRPKEAKPRDATVERPPAGYPLFCDPEQYTRFREGTLALGFLKRWSERRAIARCLKEVADARSTCDVPCGPGRLFSLWRKWFASVTGVDLSDSMVEAAGRRARDLRIAGRVLKADVFHLREALVEPVDLIASVRFCYYFDRPWRVRLLSALAAASRRYVLVQYKTSETPKGRRNQARPPRPADPQRRRKHWCTNEDILGELAEAGLRCLRIAPIGWASDFTFVLAERV